MWSSFLRLFTLSVSTYRYIVIAEGPSEKTVDACAAVVAALYPRPNRKAGRSFGVPGIENWTISLLPVPSLRSLSPPLSYLSEQGYISQSSGYLDGVPGMMDWIISLLPVPSLRSLRPSSVLADAPQPV